ncbi:MAG: hypothetical protein FK733_05045 [Asgard group archaeon]|nr:hypothetical protein [Asgard group archaeon]
MIGIVELPKRVKTTTKRIVDSQDEFLNKINSSQLITYSLDYFASCFRTDQVQLKSVNVRLFNLNQNHRPEITQYMISWEDISKEKDESWLDFQVKVDFQLKQFLTELKDRANVIEGSL